MWNKAQTLLQPRPPTPYRSHLHMMFQPPPHDCQDGKEDGRDRTDCPTPSEGAGREVIAGKLWATPAQIPRPPPLVCWPGDRVWLTSLFLREGTAVPGQAGNLWEHLPGKDLLEWLHQGRLAAPAPFPTRCGALPTHPLHLRALQGAWLKHAAALSARFAF
ncbi:PREDICTED: uncharacterized protein LOC101363502 [Odobenus rosmarus divergens]|uniref:Uncharacterized protein LOC101363502 n=1 Tax=Odobenus rosmarus divergens TaxID=9708 RepID=A0A9B0HG53_ODORO